MDKQAGAAANEVRLAFFKVILVTERIRGSQEWEPRAQVPGHFRAMLTEPETERHRHI